MAKYRNITTDTLAVDLGLVGAVVVEPDGVFEVPDGFPSYIQTGETGEPALFELVAAPTTKKAASAAKED